MAYARLLGTVTIAAAVFVPSVALAQPQPYPPQPYPPQRPYPQPVQPYPYPPQPVTPYAPPQAPLLQPQYQPPPPPPAPPPTPTAPSSSPATKLNPSSLFDWGFSGAIGGAVTHQSVQLGAPEYRSWSGGVFVYANGVGTLLGVSARDRFSLNLGGGGVGLDARYTGQLYLGPSFRIFDFATVMLHVGLEGYGLVNDEIRASLIELPATEIGLLFDIGPAKVALGPTAGLVLEDEYEPGDEDQGRRFRRKRTSDLGIGGFGSITWEYFAIDAAFTRVTAKNPLYVADGEACIFVSPLAVCGFAQYWRSVATFAQPGLPVGLESSFNIPTLYAGGAIALGVAR